MSRCSQFHEIAGAVPPVAVRGQEEEVSIPTIPDELLFQGVVEVLTRGKEPYTQEWGRRYMCVWCNPPCIALYMSEMAAKSQPEYYIWLPPGSEWHEDSGFQGAAPGTSFRLEAQVGGSLCSDSHRCVCVGMWQCLVDGGGIRSQRQGAARRAGLGGARRMFGQLPS